MLILGPLLITFAALLMAFTWTVYLRQVDIYKREKWGPLIVAFAVGCLMVLPAFYISLPIIRVGGAPGNFWNALVFFSFNVGVLEEFFKFAAFILVWIVLHRRFDEAPNFMIYASIVALGFATVENFIYFTNYGVHLVYLRGMMSTFSHMFFTSLVAVFFYTGLKKNRLLAFLFAFGGFLLASFMHGLFDAFLVYREGAMDILGEIFAFCVFMISIEVWSKLFNNFLNRSRYFSVLKCLDRFVIQRMLIGSFFIAGCIQVVGLTARYGFQAGILENSWMLIKEVTFSVILITRITRFKLVPGKWVKIWPLFPFEIKRFRMFNAVTGKKEQRWYIGIRGDEFNEYPFTRHLHQMVQLLPLLSQNTRLKKPVYAFMTDKVFLGKNDEVYYVMEMCEEPLDVPGYHQTEFLLRPKTSGVIRRVQGKYIAGIVLLPETGYRPGITNAEMSFYDWSLIEIPRRTRFKKWWRRLLK